MLITNKKKMVGDKSGMVTWNNCLQKDAPSTSAASINESEMFWRPAKKNTRLYPKLFQMDVTISMVKARVG